MHGQPYIKIVTLPLHSPNKLPLNPALHFHMCRVKTECDGTRAEIGFGLPEKRTSPFISAGVSVQSAAGSRGVRISASNAG